MSDGPLVRATDDRLLGMGRTDVIFYTQGWDFDEPANAAPVTQVRGRMFVNGHETPGFESARIDVGSDFLTVSVRLSPSTLKVVPLANINDITTVLPEPV